MIDMEPVVAFRFQDGLPLLNLLFMDEYNLPVLVVKDGLMVVSTRPWDITFKGTVLTIREGKRRIWLQVSFEPPSTVQIKRGLLMLNGVAVSVNKNGFECLNTHTRWSRCGATGLRVGLAFGFLVPGLSAGWSMPKVPRYAGVLPK